MKSKNEEVYRQPTFLTSLLAGAIAGPVVDMTLFPLDSLKTQMQSSRGLVFSTSSFTGFLRLYKGITVAALG